MKFNKYRIYHLSEGRTKELHFDSEEHIIDTIYKECSEFMDELNRVKLFRGKSDIQSFSYINPKEHVRDSKGLNNLYHKIIDEHPNWKKFPPRSHSVIVSGEYEIAENYGNVNMVIPINGAKWGVCEESDFWYSFRKPLGGFNLSEMEGWFFSFSTLYLRKDLPKFRNLNEIEAHCKEMQKAIDAMKGKTLEDVIYQDAMGFIEAYVKDKTPIYDTLVDVLSPESADIKLCTNANLKKELIRIYNEIEVGAECWTDSPCYLIDYDFANKSDYLMDALDLYGITQ